MADKTQQTQPTEARVHEVANALQGHIQNARLIGRLVDGKLEIDKDQLDELAKTRPNALFLALNSPFDPVSQID